MTTKNQPQIVSGAVSTVADLGKDDTWLQGWLKDEPVRLGLGDIEVADGDPVQDDNGNPAFLASDGDRYFSVDVQLGEMEASHGFQVLDNWARNRVRHPDKTHVAVLVTETASDRYRTTLEALAEHLPLVVVELAVWRGDTEAILVPRVALASDDVDLSTTPAVAAAEATKADMRDADADDAAPDADSDADADADAEAEAATDEAPDTEADDPDDPWKLPKTAESETLSPSESGSLAGVAGK